MKKIITFLKKYYLDYIFLFILSFIYYTFLQYNNYIGDPDGFYHTKMTLFLREGILLKSLPWMQFSSLKENFTDHQFLYHIILIPFTFIKNPLIGIKIATIFFTSSMITTFYYLLKKLKIIWPWLFSILFITIQGLNFRLALIKTNSLSLLIIYLLIYAIFFKKYKLLFSLGFIFVYLYGGWPLAILILLFYFLADFIYKKIHSNKLKLFFSKIVYFFTKKDIEYSNNLKLITVLLLGILIGLIINPYWPHNIYYYYQQVIQIGIINLGQKFIVGGEWYGASLQKIISSAPHLFFFANIVWITLILDIKKISKKTWFSFLLSFFFLLLTVKSSRYIEYFWPFTMLFIASGFTDINKIMSWEKIKKNYWQKQNKYLKIYLSSIIFTFFLIIIISMFENTVKTKIPTDWPINKFKQSSVWLKNNTEEKEIIFHDSWSAWPLLFYNNTNNYYLIGLDPTFMYNFNSELHQLYIDITNGKIKKNLSKIIKNKFNSNIILVEKEKNKEFFKNLNLDFNIKKVYENDEVSIYKIKE